MTRSARPLAAEAVSEDTSANTIDKVRDLLFGEAKREHDNRIAELNDAMIAMNDRMAEQFRAMEAKMEAMAQALAARREEDLRRVGEAIVSVGQQIAALGNARGHDRDRKA
jgi:phage host-nuclease inhibitor protein Gam